MPLMKISRSGAAQPVALNRVLVHHAENIILRVIEINIVDMQRDIIDVIPDKIESLHDKPRRLAGLNSKAAWTESESA
jgi:hypothetical protein